MVDQPSIFDHSLAVLFGIYIPLVSGFRSARQFKHLHLGKSERSRFYLVNSAFLGGMGLIVLANWVLHGRSLTLLGLTQVPQLNFHTLLYTGLFLVLYIGDLLSNTSSQKRKADTLEHWNQHTPFLPRHGSELPVYTLMCLAAGVGEEIVFRGFMIQYGLSLFSNYLPAPETWAVVLPALIFAIAHYYQRFKAVVKIAVLSVLFGWIYLYSQSLWIVMALHFGVDWLGGYLSTRMEREE